MTLLILSLCECAKSVYCIEYHTAVKGVTLPFIFVYSRRVADGFVLLPSSASEARDWVSLLCSPLCGASLLVPLAGIDLEVRKTE